MRQILAVLLCLLLSVLPSCSPSAATDVTDGAGDAGGGTAGLVADEQQVVPDELVVVPAPGAGEDDLDALFSELGASVKQRLTEYSLTLIGVDPSDRDDVRDALEQSNLIDQVGDNNVVDVEAPGDDATSSQSWHLDAVNVAAALTLLDSPTPVRIAILDSGVDTDHGGLATLLRNGGNTFDGGSWEDTNGHGTAVAGMIASVLTNRDSARMSTWRQQIVPIRITNNDDQATSWTVAAGIALAVDSGARVINISVGPFNTDEIILRSAQRAKAEGALVFMAAGNDGARVDGGDSERAMFVNAVDSGLTLASFSTYGDFIDLTAPGVEVHTTQLGGFYGGSSGTSFATPMATAVAALVWSVRGELSPSTVYGILLSTAQDLGSVGEDARYGAGLLDAEAAVALAQAIADAPDNTPPTVTISQPADGAGVAGQVVVSASVADDSDLADVKLYVDGNVVAVDQVSPYAFVFDTTDYSTGSHTLRVVATDFAGNAGEDRISAEFEDAADSEAPTVGFVSPSDGDVVRGTVTVLVDARDNRLLAEAALLVDGQEIERLDTSDNRARIPFTWDTAASGQGARRLTVRVSDAAGNTTSASVTVTVGV